MRALEISLNGQKLCVAGVGDDGVLSAVVNWVAKGGEGDGFLEVGGRNKLMAQQASWIHQRRLQVQDEIQIRIVEINQPDEPIHKSGAELPTGRHIGGIIGPY